MLCPDENLVTAGAEETLVLEAHPAMVVVIVSKLEYSTKHARCFGRLREVRSVMGQVQHAIPNLGTIRFNRERVRAANATHQNPAQRRQYRRWWMVDGGC